MKEKDIYLPIFKTVGAMPDIRIFRNNVGVGFIGTMQYECQGIVTLSNARRVRFGLHVGSGDLIGWRSVHIGSGDVGRKIAQFVSIETKSPCGRPSNEQINWRDQIISAGGIAGIVRSVDEATALFD